MPKSTIKGENHFTSTIFILTKEKPVRVLMVHNKKLNKWVPPGGHQEFGENPYITAIREAKEETGIDISPYLVSPKRIDYRAEFLPSPQYILLEKIESSPFWPTHTHTDMIYVVYLPYQKAVLSSREASDIGWFTKAEIEKLDTYQNIIAVLSRI